MTKRIEKNPNDNKEKPSTQETAETRRIHNPTAGCWRPSGDSEGEKLGERTRLIDEAQAVGDGESGRPQRHTTQFLAFLGGGCSFDQSRGHGVQASEFLLYQPLFREPPMHTAPLAPPGLFMWPIFPPVEPSQVSNTGTVLIHSQGLALHRGRGLWFHRTYIHSRVCLWLCWLHKEWLCRIFYKVTVKPLRTKERIDDGGFMLRFWHAVGKKGLHEVASSMSAS